MFRGWLVITCVVSGISKTFCVFEVIYFVLLSSMSAPPPPYGNEGIPSGQPSLQQAGLQQPQPYPDKGAPGL